MLTKTNAALFAGLTAGTAVAAPADKLLRAGVSVSNTGTIVPVLSVVRR